MTERIAAAAIQAGELTLSQRPPGRHHTILRSMEGLGIPASHARNAEQGFVTSTGRFVDRREGMHIARAAGQLIPRAGGYMAGEISTGDELFSEDVW